LLAYFQAKADGGGVRFLGQGGGEIEGGREAGKERGKQRTKNNKQRKKNEGGREEGREGGLAHLQAKADDEGVRFLGQRVGEGELDGVGKTDDVELGLEGGREGGKKRRDG